MPLAAYGSGALGLSSFRDVDGFGTFIDLQDKPTPSAMFIFVTGEMWGVDAYSPNVDRGIFFPIDTYARALDHYREFMEQQLEIAPPYKCLMTIDAIKDKQVWRAPHPGRSYLNNPMGSCVAHQICREISIIRETKSHTVVADFFKEIVDQCGLEDVGYLGPDNP